MLTQHVMASAHAGSASHPVHEQLLGTPLSTPTQGPQLQTQHRAVLRAGGCSCHGENKQSPRTGTVTLCKHLPRSKHSNEHPLPCLGAIEGQEVALAPLPLLQVAVPAKASCSCREMEQQVSVQL